MSHMCPSTARVGLHEERKEEGGTEKEGERETIHFLFWKLLYPNIKKKKKTAIIQ